MATDVSDEKSVQCCITEATQVFGSLDILINNAAVLWPLAPVQKTSNAEFDRLISVNLRSAFWFCKYSYPHLQQSRGCLLNISSMAGLHGKKVHAIYALTKGALNALTQSLVVDWGADGIRCNALCPSSVLTPNVDAAIAAQPNAPEIVELRKKINALGYTATPDEIAAAALFLVSPAASFITGAIVPVSGGSECGYGLNTSRRPCSSALKCSTKQRLLDFARTETEPRLRASIAMSHQYKLPMKYIPLTDEIYQYVIDHRSHSDDAEVLDELRTETEALGSISGMQISREQGSFFSLLVAAAGARNAIEIGTFTGYSALCIARGLPAGGKLLCLDQSDEWTRVGRKYWRQAGLESKIDLQIGDAKSTLAAMPEEEQFDFAFIDAEKTGYDTYLELLLPRVKPNALLIFDNMLSGGRLATGVLGSDSERALDALNNKLASDSRVESVLLPLADGLNICRKL